MYRLSTRARLFTALLAILLSACARQTTEPAQRLQARWQIIDGQGMSVPNSFFWLSMDYVEFRADGTVWGLMGWPPGEDGDLHLNATAHYTLVAEDQIEFVGSCRHEDPCTGRYAINFQGNKLEITDEDRRLVLQHAGSLAEKAPPPPPGPAPSPTSADTR